MGFVGVLLDFLFECHVPLLKPVFKRINHVSPPFMDDPFQIESNGKRTRKWDVTQLLMQFESCTLVFDCFCSAKDTTL